jgi:hypothetical protein
LDAVPLGDGDGGAAADAGFPDIVGGATGNRERE